jgi:hypothetical protein
MSQPGGWCQAKTGCARGGGGEGLAREQEGGDTGRGRSDDAARRVILSGSAAMDSGGPWARPGQSPRWVRIFSMTSGCSMKAMMRMGPPHWGHSKGPVCPHRQVGLVKDSNRHRSIEPQGEPSRSACPNKCDKCATCPINSRR